MGVMNLQDYTKGIWKQMVKKYTTEVNKTRLIEMSKKYKKINHEEMEKEPFGRKPFFDKMKLDDVRYRFRIANNLVQGIRKNYSDKYRRMNKSLTCPSCSETNKQTDKEAMTQSHILYRCEAFSDLRYDLVVEDDAMLVDFFRLAVDRITESESDD